MARITKRAKREHYVVISHDGDPCPTCGQPTEIREHDAIAEKQLLQVSYYSRWFICTNPNFRTKRILPERYIVWNARSSAWDV